MALRPRTLSALLVSTAFALTATAGLGGLALTAQASPDTGTAVHANMDHSAVAPVATGDDPDGDGYIPAVPQVTGVTPSWENPPDRYFHEFQANCAVTRTASDDPIVYPGRVAPPQPHLPGQHHDRRLQHDRLAQRGRHRLHGPRRPLRLLDADAVQRQPAGPADRSAGDLLQDGRHRLQERAPLPQGPAVPRRQSDPDGRRVPGPPGLGRGLGVRRQLQEHRVPGELPGFYTQLNIRMQAPSCWDGKYLDTPDHKAHMAYPVVKPGNNDNVCPASHPVALPMVEFKMAFPVSGDMSQVRLSSGSGHSFHYDFFNAWDDRTLAALVDHCIRGGLQCNSRGYDETHPEAGAALGPDHRLP